MRDERDFAELYRRRYPAIYAYGVRRVGPESAREVAAEVFLVLWRRRIELAEDEELPWLYGTARKVTANLLRSEKRRSALTQRVSSVIAVGVAGQLDPMGAVDAVLDVRAALGRLSPKDQEALLLVEWEGVDLAAGARITGCSPNTFKVRVHRARRKLGELLKDQAAPAVGVLAVRKGEGDD
ncbi:MAG TPA: RNA polymerase sigma factor [Kribbella sp.]|uniref:RNA polymerase sigma factor n=1 Tax=Kribbella sp. TaxID=1871183 RepID=UPI002D799D62|nr:RNA polymerase sigma factor [Kribbella sp.]HET6297018.1 RNA polymerase sigma factor [Kribbella sp.]